MMRKAAVLLIVVVLLLSSCVYTWRDDTSSLRHMGKEESIVVTLDTAALRASEASSFLPDGEIMERLDKIAVELTPEDDSYPLPLSSWSITGTVNGKISSTEAGTLLSWDPEFIRWRGSGPRHYVNRDLGISAGIPKDGILLFTTSDYGKAYSSLFSSSESYIDDETAFAMESSIAAVYINAPLTLPPLGFDLTKESVRKMERILLLADHADDESFFISGEILMDGEDGARTLCTFLRNLLIQDVRRRGEKLDVRALSGIFTYEGPVLRISDYRLPFDTVSQLLTKE